MSRRQDWLTLLRAIAGIGTLAWELPVERGHQWWILIFAAWLLGAPFEELVRLLTSGRIQIDMNKTPDPDPDPDPKKPVP